MLTKITGLLALARGRRTYLLGVAVALLGVAVASGVVSAEEAAQIRALLETGWEQLFGLLATLVGLALAAQRAGSKADSAALAAQIAELKAALEAANKESGPR